MSQSTESANSNADAQASDVVYQGSVTWEQLPYATPSALGNGTITIVNQNTRTTAIPVTFTIIAVTHDTQAAVATQTITFQVQGPADQVAHVPSGNVSIWLPTASGATDGSYSPMALATIQLTATTPVAIAAASSILTTSVFSGSTSSPASTVAASSATSTSASKIPATSHRSSFGTGTMAGVAVGCLFAGILLTALALFLCSRRNRLGRKGAFAASEKQRFLSESHGEAVYVVGPGGEGWQKHLPQADPDSAIRASASTILDQVAMHVENYYTPKNNVRLSTEDEFALEVIDSSDATRQMSTLLQQPGQIENLIKHFISAYLLSMICFDNTSAAGTLLPKLYRRQWQPVTQQSEDLDQAYSHWRVLTAHLRDKTGNESTYIAERDAAINVAARQIHRAFDPWAKNQDDNRFQNMVGIMKRASELGVLLFAQPARFEWQWETPRTVEPLPASDASTDMVVLPGLYKTTDQKAVPLASPIHLVEPTIVAL